MQENDLKVSELELRREHPELFTNKPLPDDEPRDGSYTALVCCRVRRVGKRVRYSGRRVVGSVSMAESSSATVYFRGGPLNGKLMALPEPLSRVFCYAVLLDDEQITESMLYDNGTRVLLDNGTVDYRLEVDEATGALVYVADPLRQSYYWNAQREREDGGG